MLVRAGVGVTMTGVYASHQALSAVAVGAAYAGKSPLADLSRAGTSFLPESVPCCHCSAAPYLGRMTDNGKDGRAQCVQMQQIIQAAGSKTRLLVASIRSPEDIAYLAAHGCNTFTIQPAICAQLFEERLTIAAAASFEQAARRMGAVSVPFRDSV